MIRLALVIGLSLLARPVVATNWTVDPMSSEIAFSGTHLGDVFEGVFEKWSSDISFDPANLGAAHVRVVVLTGSAKTGNKLYDGTLDSGDWFNVDRHPQAVFVATGFTAKDADRYSAVGVLTIKDNSVPLTLEFTLGIEDGTVTMNAKHMLDRTKLGLGVGSDPEGKWVSREIFVDIQVVATAR